MPFTCQHLAIFGFDCDIPWILTVYNRDFLSGDDDDDNNHNGKDNHYKDGQGRHN